MEKIEKGNLNFQSNRHINGRNDIKGEIIAGRVSFNDYRNGNDDTDPPRAIAEVGWMEY